MNKRLNTLFALFIALLIGMNILGTKITTIVGISVSVGIFMVPLTFLITDIVEEVYGKAVAREFIKKGVFIIVVVFLYTSFFVWLEPNERYTNNEQYSLIFGSSLRIMIASVIAFVLSQLHDTFTFGWLKEKTEGKMLWLRNNVSTWISQFIDTFLFMMIAFLGVSPKFTFGFVMSLIIPYYIFKLVFAALDTPLVYAGVSWLKAGKEENIELS